MSAPTKSEKCCAQVWTDHLGVVHERTQDDHGLTLCGLDAGESNRTISARACRSCIAQRLASECPWPPKAPVTKRSVTDDITEAELWCRKVVDHDE